MDPAEEIVGEWLQSQGFFVMSNIICRDNKEIDFLGANPVTGEKVHVEVHVSPKPAHPLRAWAHAKYGKEKIEIRLKHWFDKKFIGTIGKPPEGILKNHEIEEIATEKLGTRSYKRWLVLGNLEKDSPAELVKVFKELGVEVFFFREDVFTRLLSERTKRRRFIELLKYATNMMAKR